MSTLSREIAKIGNRMVHCKLHCKGITNDPDSKIIPRCLYLDPRDAESVDCVIVGINPGPLVKGKHKTSTKKRYYERYGTEYKNVVDCFYKHTKTKTLYYKKLKVLANELGFKSILWTELCKCEKDKKQGAKVPVQTFRTCIGEYLERELKAVGPDVPLIGVGDKAYRALSYRFPNRRIIGVPHPSTRGKYWEDWKAKDLEAVKAVVDNMGDHECVRVFVSDFKNKHQRSE